MAFRKRLIEAQMDRRLIERTIEIATKTQAFGPRALRAALDSSPSGQKNLFHAPSYAKKRWNTPFSPLRFFASWLASGDFRFWEGLEE